MANTIATIPPDSTFSANDDNALKHDSEDKSFEQLANPAAHFAALKHLTVGTVSCFLAHWYLLPGLTFQRQRIRFGAASILNWGTSSRAALASFVIDPPEPSSYLDFDFARKALASLETLGRYLDVSSPTLFPTVVLSRHRAMEATLLSLKPDTLNAIVTAAQISLPGGVSTDSILSASLESEAYDVVTSLTWLSTVKDDTSVIQTIWRALKPGGLLLLSVSCASVAREESREEITITDHEGSNFRRLCDSYSLRTRIFSLIGQPKRFTIYGEVTGSYKAHLLTDPNAWRAPLLLGKDWRCYSRIEELPGEGVIAMKFVKDTAAITPFPNR